jgi:hypothetical protein
MPLAVFYSYSHKDEILRNRLETHLALLERNGLILPWHDRCIGAGDEWGEQIDEHLQAAQIILLLVSPDFLASRYCFDIEMKAALDRNAKQQAIVIPIVLRPCDWSGAPFAHLQALPRDAKAVALWPDQDEAFAEIAKAIRETAVRFQQPAPEPPRFASLADQMTPKPRVLDAAMPSHIVKDRATELLVLIRLPDSKGLAGMLQADDEADARPEDVRSKPFDVTFPPGPTGAPQPLKVTVELTSPDFSPPSQRKNIFVPVNADGEVCPFLLTPARTGPLVVTIELVWEDAERGYRRLRTNCVSEAELPAGKSVMSVVQLHIGVASGDSSAVVPPSPDPSSSPAASRVRDLNEGTARRRTPPHWEAEVARQRGKLSKASSYNPYTPPGAPPSASYTAPASAAPRKVSFMSSPGLKVAALVICVLTAGTLFFQQQRYTAPHPESAEMKTASPADIESAALEFKKASEPAAGMAAGKPELAAVIKSGQENLTAARVALAKGNKQKAEQHLKLVRLATQTLKKN